MGDAPNAITRVEIEDFLVFKGEFTADFCPGVNVLIGGNGSGKTTLMKVMYAACGIIDHSPAELEIFNIGEYFNADIPKRIFADKNIRPPCNCDIRIFNIDVNYKSAEEVGFNVNAAYYKGLLDLVPQIKVECQYGNGANAVYIPTTEILSHSKGLMALNYDREISFDKTEMDLLAKAEKGAKRDVSSITKKLLETIAPVIGGEVLYKNDDFFIDKSGVGEVKFSLEASGFQKLGLLWKLLRNGFLEPGAILFWDEPEASINPELIPTLVDILLELQRGGVQIFVATHSFDVARWIELNKQPENTLRYFNLRKERGRIVADVAEDYETLPRSVIDEADDVLLRRSVQAAAASAGVNIK
jgi:AAA15 family ATPase/GTPase